MPKHRIFPALAVATLIPLAAWAQVPSAPAAPTAPAPAAPTAATPAPNEPPTEAETEIDAAIKKVAALKSVAADITQSVDLLDQKFTVQGRYLKAPGRRVYLKLKVSGLPDAEGVTLQVCDGETLWDYQQILDMQAYRKVEVGKIAEKLKSPDLDETYRQQVNSQLGFSGPEELLTGLRRAVKFDQKAAATLDGKAVWVLRGNWRSREGLLGPNQQPLPATAPLPPYVPSLVTVYVGKEDGWPYKVVFVGKVPSVLMDTRRLGPDGRPIGSRNSIQTVKPTRIDLLYSGVKLNPDLKLDEFVFQAPPGASVTDQTQALSAALDQAIQVSAAKKKAEAAKAGTPASTPADDALLKQSIDVPRAASPAPAPGASR